MTSDRFQLAIFAALTLGVTALTAVLYRRDSLIFQRFLGRIHPLLAIVGIGLLGMVLLSILLSRRWFAIYSGELRWVLPGSLALATLFALVMILVDARAPLPEDINVAFPGSLLFYPVMAYIAEVIFHLLPLTLLLVLLTSLAKGLAYERIVWYCLVLVALADPIFQTVAGLSRPQPLWSTAYVAVHVFLINLVELWLFKRYDFASMYAFRLAYYTLWHVAWGHVRLGLLF